ncbi:unnamed protein product [Urochloa humidicola]
MMPPTGRSTPKGAAIMPTDGCVSEGFRLSLHYACRAPGQGSSLLPVTSALPPSEEARRSLKHHLGAPSMRQPALKPHHHGGARPTSATKERGAAASPVAAVARPWQAESRWRPADLCSTPASPWLAMTARCRRSRSRPRCRFPQICTPPAAAPPPAHPPPHLRRSTWGKPDPQPPTPPPPPHGRAATGDPAGRARPKETGSEEGGHAAAFPTDRASFRRPAHAAAQREEVGGRGGGG